MPHGCTRRSLVARLCLAAWPLSLSVPVPAAPDAAQDHSIFRELSAYLTGMPRIDEAQATRVHAALTAHDPAFPEAAGRLWAWIGQKRADPLELQKLLDAEAAPFAALPRAIAMAWFMGIVGEGANARVVALEHALNAAIVGDVLKPPTYCYGGYASWSRPPPPA